MRLRGRDQSIQTRINTLYTVHAAPDACTADTICHCAFILCSVEDLQLYFGLNHGFAGCLINCVVT